MDRFKAIVVDDEIIVCEAVKAILETEDIDVEMTISSLAAVDMIKHNAYDLIISDVKMPEMDGFELYESIRDHVPESIFIIITAYGTISSAVEAIKKGIYDYIPKPFTPDEVRIPVRRAIEKKRLERENIALRSQIEARYSFRNIIGNSTEMHEVFRIMRHAASSESNVLITGESGTGKELVARAIHSNSVRTRKKFVTVNCGAIPEGLMESELFGHVKGAFTGAVSEKRGLVEEAHKGTLFLDEIGELPQVLQVKLLRVLQDGDFSRLGDPVPRNVNVRVLAATNRDLKKAIAEKNFREDLYYRLNVIPIELPPLRKRTEDIPMLVNFFLDKHKTKAVEKNITGISKEAMQALLNYYFPGNVRELENAVEYAIAFTEGPAVQKDDLPKYIIEDKKLSEEARSIPIMPLKDAKAQFEKGLIMAALIESGGNISEASRLLNIHRQNLQQKIRLLGIDLASVSLS
jgi:DNA-binding NtrC family response regulator